MTENHTQEPQPGPVGFGLAELTFLLGGFEGPSHDRSVAALDFAQFVSDETLTQVGASALAARGYLSLEEEGVSVDGAASVVAQVLGNAQTWFTILLSDGPGQTTRLVLAASEQGRLLFQPGILQSWFAVQLPEDLTLEQVAVSILHQHQEENASMTALVTATTLERQSTYSVVPKDDTWSFAGVGPQGVEEPVTGLGPAELAALLEAAIA